MRNKVSQGVAYYNGNKGIQSTTGEFILFLDDDAYIDHLDLAEVENFFRENPSVGILAPRRIVYLNGKIQESVRSFPSDEQYCGEGYNSIELLNRRRGIGST